MKYWWVNHKQTFKEEFGGGFIWSPQLNKDNSFNQTYLNLTETKIGDVIFSYADKLIKAVGVIRAGYINSLIPPELLRSKNRWNKKGYLVRVNWMMLDESFSPKNNIKLIKHLLPPKFSPVQKSGNGNQKFYLTELSAELGACLLLLIEKNNPSIGEMLDQLKSSTEEDAVEQTLRNNKDVVETERTQLIKARKGQGLFRQNVFSIESKCRITGVTDKQFLVASHIKPWKQSDNFEKLDGNNGLLLSPHIDCLFDKGWISFSDSGDILIASDSVSRIMKNWNVNKKNVGPFNEHQRPYLEYHRKSIFKANKVIDVTAGIIERAGKILIAKRKKGKHLEGFWEFPGGKIEDGESPEECLVRELGEEFSIKVKVLGFVGESIYMYADKTIRLLGYEVRYLSGDFVLKEHDEIKWVSKRGIAKYKLAPADVPILSLYFSRKQA